MSFSDAFISRQDTETHRICGACGELKPLEEFYKDGKDGNNRTKYRRDCKACYKVARAHEAKMKKGRVAK